MTAFAAYPPQRERRQRRRHPTRPLPATLGRHPIQIVDLSVGGLGFTTTEAMHPFDRYEIRIPTAQGDLCASGRLVWCRIAKTETTVGGDVTPTYRGGLRFEPLSQRDAELVLSLLEDLRAPTPATDPRDRLGSS